MTGPKKSITSALFFLDRRLSGLIIVKFIFVFLYYLCFLYRIAKVIVPLVN